MTIRPQATDLSAARKKVSALARELRFDENQAYELLIAVGEAISNAYLHGCPDRECSLIHIDWRYTDDILTVRVRDEGLGFKHREPPLKDARPASMRGHGIPLMHKSVDEVRFEYNDGAAVVLKKRGTL